MVSSAYTIVEKRTVVVHQFYTKIALMAMITSDWHDMIAIFASLINYVLSRPRLRLTIVSISISILVLTVFAPTVFVDWVL